MINSILIRKAKKSDVHQVYAVFLDMVKSEDASSKKVSNFLMDLRKKRKDFVVSAKKELLREFKENNSIYLVAERNKKVLGYVRGTIVENKNPFFKSIKLGYLNAIVVLKKYTGKGIASLLNKSIERRFKENNCSQIHLEVFEHSPSISIYEKWGYKKFNIKMAKKI